MTPGTLVNELLASLCKMLLENYYLSGQFVVSLLLLTFIICLKIILDNQKKKINKLIIFNHDQLGNFDNMNSHVCIVII